MFWGRLVPVLRTNVSLPAGLELMPLPAFLGGGNNPRRVVSDATAQAIDREVRGLVDRAHDRALSILRHNRELLESISQKILEKEVIEGDELKELLASSVMPQEAQLAA